LLYDYYIAGGILMSLKAPLFLGVIQRMQNAPHPKQVITYIDIA
jgi:hypothetical protein